MRPKRSLSVGLGISVSAVGDFTRMGTIFRFRTEEQQGEVD